MEAERKYEDLLRILKEQESLAVAFSGGVDSTFLLYAARQALGDRAVALTCVSDFIPEREKKEAAAFCREKGIRQIIIDYPILEREEIARNPKDRCYLCKKALFGQFVETAHQMGIHAVAEGSNLDDLSDWRPGLHAINELGILSPLRQAQLTKAEIRQLSNRAGLETWNKPSFACLASRFVYGETITKEKLQMVEKAEELLRSLGFLQFRVRIHGTMARIEVLPEQFDLLLGEPVRTSVTKELRCLGFSHVSMDLEGYRTGSMN